MTAKRAKRRPSRTLGASLFINPKALFFPHAAVALQKGIKSGMIRYAEEIGAVRGKKRKRIVWYLVAENLAAQVRPELLVDPSPPRPGRKKEAWDELYFAINWVRREQSEQGKKRGVRTACGLLSKGYRPRHTGLRHEEQGVATARWDRWRGRKVETLEQRYYEYVRLTENRLNPKKK